MNLKHAPSFIVGVTIAAMLVAAVVVPTINSAELGQTYNVPTHGKEQLIANKDFDWWVDYWKKYDCQSAYVDLYDDGGLTCFVISDKNTDQHWSVFYDPDFDMSYDIHGTWIIQFNSIDGVAIGDNYLISTNAPTLEYNKAAVCNRYYEVPIILAWENTNPTDLYPPHMSEFNRLILNPPQGGDVDVGDGYYLISHHSELATNNYEDYYYNVTSLGIVNVGGDSTIKTLLFIIPVLMLAGLVITVAMSLRVQRD